MTKIALCVLLTTGIPGVVGAGAAESPATGAGVAKPSFVVQKVPGAGSLLGVSFTDAEHGHVVDDAAGIFATSDGGATWSRQPSPASGKPNAVLFDVSFVDAQHGHATGPQDIVGTSDGGQTWVAERLPQVPSGPVSPRVVTFTDPDHGYIAGESGTILTTTDGGKTWLSVGDRKYGSMLGIAFPDANHGYIVCPCARSGSPTTLATTDAGKTWNLQDAGLGFAGGGLQAISFTDKNNGHVAGRDGRILATTDGGQTWLLHRRSPGDDIQSVSFADPLRGLAVGRKKLQPALFATSDGGKTWVSQSIPWEGGFRIQFAGPTTAYATGSAGTVLKITFPADLRLGGSIDTGSPSLPGGLHVQPQVSHTTDPLFGVSFPDADHGHAVGDRGLVLATDDGGGSWKRQPTPAKKRLLGVSFSDAQNGHASGLDGTIIATSNGGKTWTTQDSGSNEALSAVTFLDKQTGYAIGRHATILATTDAGKTWKAQTVTKPGPEAGPAYVDFGDFTGLSFTDSKHGYVVDRATARVLTTQDAGKTWTLINPTFNEQLRGVSFSTGDVGHAVGNKGQILATKDASKTWQAQRCCKEPEILYSASFAGKEAGIALGTTLVSSPDGVTDGQRGIILATADGGAKWAEYPTPNTSVLTSASYPRRDTAYAVGFGGSILKITSAGNQSGQPSPKKTYGFPVKWIVVAIVAIGLAAGVGFTLRRRSHGGAA